MREEQTRKSGKPILTIWTEFTPLDRMPTNWSCDLPS